MFFLYDKFMEMFLGRLGNDQAAKLIVLLLSAFFVSCVRMSTSCSDAQRITMADIVVTCLYDDDVIKLKKLIDVGLPINNYYDNDGNYEDIGPRRACNSSINSARTILLEALYLNAINCVKLLMSEGADVLMVDEEGNNALLMLAYLSEDDSVEIANKIWEYDTLEINATNVYNATALGVAIRRNNGAYVRWLLEHGADYTVVNGVYDSKTPIKRPITFDAASSRMDIFDMLFIEYGARIEPQNDGRRGVLEWLKPDIDNYEYRFQFLTSMGAEARVVQINYNILVKNMRKLGDCPDRISMICAYGLDCELLEVALLYAKKKNYLRCVEVIESYLRRDCMT